MATSQPSIPASDHPIQYRPDIDGLRAIAILLVVVFHAFPDLVPGGFIGVDIFFVISGFLISSVILTDLDSKSFNYMRFYARRIRRLFPALLIVMFTCFCVGWCVLLSNEFRQLAKHIVAGSAFISNFALWKESSYFDNLADTKPLLHLWSLAIEEQFYLIWPAILVMLWKRRESLLIHLFCLMLVSYAVNIQLLPDYGAAAFYSPFSRLWELAAGGLLAFINIYHPFSIRSWGTWCSTLGLSILLVCSIAFNNGMEFPGWRALFPVAATLLIIISGSTAWVNHTVLSNRFVVFLGLISYPLYLWHWPLLSFAHVILSKTPPLWMRASLVAASLVLALATYALEIWVRRSMSLAKAFGIFGSLLIALGVLGFDEWQDTSMPSGITRYKSFFTPSSPGNHRPSVDPNIQALGNCETILKHDSDYVTRLETQRLTAIRQNECHLSGAPGGRTFDDFKQHPGRCLTISREKPNILVVGDSHAADLYVALSQTHKDFAFLQATGDLCDPAVSGPGFPHDQCSRLMNFASEFAAGHKLDAVIVAARWHEVDFPGLASYVARLKEKGIKVIVAGAPLEYSADVYEILARRDTDFNLQGYLNSYIAPDSIATSQALAAFAEQNSLFYFDRIHYFCEKVCPVMNNEGQLFITDYGHLDLPGALFLGQQLLRAQVLPELMRAPSPTQRPDLKVRMEIR